MTLQAKDAITNNPAAEQAELVQVKGKFGSLNAVPLLTDLMSEELLDCIAAGFFKFNNFASGIIQNDGRMFPRLKSRVETFFSSYCQTIRKSEVGNERCKNCDIAGVNLLLSSEDASLADLGIEPRNTSHNDVACYYCHAGNIEMIAKVRVYFGEFEESDSAVIAGIWSGQYTPNRSPVELEPLLQQLHQATGLPIDSLRSTYAASTIPKDLSIDEAGGQLAASAKAISRLATDLYRRNQHEKALAVQTKISNTLGDILERKAGPNAGQASQLNHDESQAVPATLLNGLSREYNLRYCQIHAVSSRGNGLTAKRITGIGSPHKHTVNCKGSAFFDESRFSPPAPAIASYGDDPLVDKIARSAGLSGGDFIVWPIATHGDSTLLWILSEHPHLKWYVRDGDIQPTFRGMLAGVAKQVGRYLETIDALNKKENALTAHREAEEKLRNKERQTADMIVRMAHLVSRPMFELQLSIDVLKAAARTSAG